MRRSRRAGRAAKNGARQPDLIESKPVAQLNLFERIMQHLFWRHTFGSGGNGKQTEFHAVSLE